ncbi:MAG: 50S ribosomal protein L22 [Bacteroidales bacterium]|jgi:large subunit ribosomal protein L22|nr:50S ribosomal protein L22 [Bacteroidales bacterium]
MGARKRTKAEQIKEAKKSQYSAVLRNCPTSPRKMRLVADMIQGVEVNKALDMLRFSPKEATRRLEKLLLSAIANWQAKNEGARIEESHLFVKEAYVDQSRTLKRIQPAPQGRAHRIKKRSNHVTIVLGAKPIAAEVEPQEN